MFEWYTSASKPSMRTRVWGEPKESAAQSIRCTVLCEAVVVSTRFAVAVDFQGQRDGTLGLTVRSLEGPHLSADAGTVIITIWAETDGTVRARLQHISTGVTSYLQGNDTIIALAAALGLSVAP